MRLCGNRHADDVAAPLLGNKAMLGELLHNSVGICSRSVHLVYRNDYLNLSRLCVVDSLDCLRHNTVVRRNDKNGYIRCLCASCTH